MQNFFGETNSVVRASKVDVNMVDLQANDQNNCQKGNSDGKVKHLMDRTPSFLKSKFLSVLGSSNDLINGLTTKVRINWHCLSRKKII